MRRGSLHTPIAHVPRVRLQAGASQLQPPAPSGTQRNRGSGQLPPHAGALSEQVPAPLGESAGEHTWSPSRRHRTRTDALHARRPLPVVVMQAPTASPQACRQAR